MKTTSTEFVNARQTDFPFGTVRDWCRKPCPYLPNQRKLHSRLVDGRLHVSSADLAQIQQTMDSMPKQDTPHFDGAGEWLPERTAIERHNIFVSPTHLSNMRGRDGRVHGGDGGRRSGSILAPDGGRLRCKRIFRPDPKRRSGRAHPWFYHAEDLKRIADWLKAPPRPTVIVDQAGNRWLPDALIHHVFRKVGTTFAVPYIIRWRERGAPDGGKLRSEKKPWAPRRETIWYTREDDLIRIARWKAERQKNPLRSRVIAAVRPEWIATELVYEAVKPKANRAWVTRLLHEAAECGDVERYPPLLPGEDGHSLGRGSFYWRLPNQHDGEPPPTDLYRRLPAVLGAEWLTPEEILEALGEPKPGPKTLDAALRKLANENRAAERDPPLSDGSVRGRCVRWRAKAGRSMTPKPVAVMPSANSDRSAQQTGAGEGAGQLGRSAPYPVEPINTRDTPIYVVAVPDPHKPKGTAGAPEKYPRLREHVARLREDNPNATMKQIFALCRKSFSDDMPADFDQFRDYCRPARPARQKLVGE